MAKKIKSKTIRLRNKKADNSTHQKPNTTAEEDDKPFDFGGLPARDLKKNLGCG